VLDSRSISKLNTAFDGILRLCNQSDVNEESGSQISRACASTLSEIPVQGLTLRTKIIEECKKETINTEL
jgi:hypothetical protein